MRYARNCGIAILQLRTILVLIEALTEEILTRRAEAEGPSQRQQQIHAGPLQEVVRADAVERVEMTALVEEHRERARRSREKSANAPKVEPGP